MCVCVCVCVAMRGQTPLYWAPDAHPAKVSGRAQLSGAALSAQEGGMPLLRGGILPSGGDVFLRRVAFYLLRAVYMRPSKSDVLPSDRGITPIVGCIMC